MEYQEILQNARTCMGPYCKACPVCNGQACKNTIPGPGAKGSGTGFARNYQKWQELRVNLDTIGENRPADTLLPTSTRRIFSGSVSVEVSPVVPVTTMPSAPAEMTSSMCCSTAGQSTSPSAVNGVTSATRTCPKGFTEEVTPPAYRLRA